VAQRHSCLSGLAFSIQHIIINIVVVTITNIVALNFSNSV